MLNHETDTLLAIAIALGTGTPFDVNSCKNLGNGIFAFLSESASIVVGLIRKW